MAEIEHFCDPTNKDHPKFDDVKDLEVTLYSACNQMDGKLPEKVKIGDAVGQVSTVDVHVKPVVDKSTKFQIQIQPNLNQVAFFGCYLQQNLLVIQVLQMERRMKTNLSTPFKSQIEWVC